MSNPTKVVFTLPTTNVDGTPLAVKDVTGVKINILDSHGAVGVGSVVGAASLNLDASGNGFIDLPVLPSGSYSVVLFTETVSQNVAEESAGSVPVPFVIALPSVPNPPTAISVV